MKTIRRVTFDLAPWLFIAWVAGVQLYHWIEDMTPAAAWFEVRSITVSDSQAGNPIIMDVDRAIHHPFRAKWVVSVRRMTERGLEKVCSVSGENDYKVESVLPEPLTLNWWIDGAPCALTPGHYRLDTAWVLDVTGYPPKAVSAQSNIFLVRG